MRFRIEFSAQAERDFALIFAHLFENYQSFGESVAAALDHGRNRIREIRQKGNRLRAAPYRGERHDGLLQGIRHLTIDRAIFWFEVNQAEQWGIDADTAARRLYALHDGVQTSGIPSFLVLGAQMPRYRFLGRIMGLPSIRQLAGAFYDHVLAPAKYPLSPPKVSLC